MTDRKTELGQSPIPRLLARYTAPAAVAMVVTSLYNLVDAIFVGQGAGTMALAGLTVAFPIQMLIMALAQMVGLGSGSLISRSLGAGKQRLAEQVAGSSFVVSLILGAGFTALGFTFMVPFLKLFGATPLSLPYAQDYLQIIFIGSTYFCFVVSSNSIARSEGNIKIGMVSMLIGAAVNLILDPIFILGMDMGIQGAALATIIAQLFSFLYLLSYFLSGKSMLKITRKDLRPHLGSLPEVFSVGSSSFARSIATGVLAIVINNSLTHFGSEIHLALFGVCNRIIMVMFMPIFGLIQGLQPIVGFNYGSGRYERVIKALKTGLLWATVWSLFCWVLMQIFAPQILYIFDTSGALVDVGTGTFRLIILIVPVVGFQIVAASFFQHIGRARPALILSMAKQALFLIPLVLVLPHFFGLDGVWVSLPASDALATVMTAIWLIPAVRKLRKEIR